MSRKERKSYNQGKRDGYLEGYAIGYAQGLIDLYDAIAKQLEMDHQDPVCHCIPIESKDIDWDELGGDES